MNSKYLAFIVFLFFSQVVSAQPASIQKLFMTQDQRNKINTERALYLNKDSIEIETFEPEETIIEFVEPEKNLPEKLSISAVIITPDRKKIIRLNGSYQTPQGKDVSLSQWRTNNEKAAILLNGKLIKIPVGSTYLPESGEYVKNYEQFEEKLELPEEFVVEQEVRSSEEEIDELAADLERIQTLTDTMADQ